MTLARATACREHSLRATGSHDAAARASECKRPQGKQCEVRSLCCGGIAGPRPRNGAGDAMPCRSGPGSENGRGPHIEGGDVEMRHDALNPACNCVLCRDKRSLSAM